MDIIRWFSFKCNTKQYKTSIKPEVFSIIVYKFIPHQFLQQIGKHFTSPLYLSALLDAPGSLTVEYYKNHLQVA